MSVALALIAMLIELAFGYPERLLRAIGHPVTWMGSLIGALDRTLNRDADSASRRRFAGVIAVLILVGSVGLIAAVLQCAALRLPYGIVILAILASTMIAQRSLHRHVAEVALALEKSGIIAGRAALSRIVGRDTEALDEPGIARAAIESLAENFSDAIVAPVLWLAI